MRLLATALRCCPPLLAAALALPLRAQSPSTSPPPDETPWPTAVCTEAFAGNRQSGYLSSVLELLDRDREAKHGDADVRSLYLDVLGTQLALVNEEARANAAGDEAFAANYKLPKAPEKDPLASLHQQDALATLLKLAEGRRVLLLNEEPGSSMQRAFANVLLDPLKQAGFGYLAVEAIDEDGAALKARGYPVLGTGNTTRDPVLGDLIRRALATGWVVVPYEASAEDRVRRPTDKSFFDANNRREAGQARNILERALNADPTARVLVLAGRDHIAEEATGEWVPMGAVLKQLAATDPLSVNQVLMTEHSRPELEHWAFKRAFEKGWLDTDPIVLLDAGGAPWSAVPGAADVSLFHPRTYLDHGRPQWMAMGKLRRPVELTLEPQKEPTLLQAHVAGESPDAVPLDQCIVWPDQPVPALMLRLGKYEITQIDREGKELHREDTEVKDAAQPVKKTWPPAPK
jgi:hypothetical protein